MRDESEQRTWRSWLTTVAQWMDKTMYPVSLLFRYVGLWIIAAAFYDIPKPGIYDLHARSPDAAIVVLAIMIFFMAKPAAVYYKREHWGDADVE